MAKTRISKLEMMWTNEGCVAVAEGFSGVLLTCPRCQALLPRGEEHHCGEPLSLPVIKQVRKGKGAKS